MCCPTNKVVKGMYSDALAPTVVPYQTFTTILCSYHAGILERRCGEAFWTRLRSRASSFLRHTGEPLRISSLKPVFYRDKYEEYILCTTRKEAVYDVTLKRQL